MIGANIGKFISDIVELIETKKLADVTDITNESSKEGIRIALELKKNADINKIKNILYKKTKLEDTFGVNMLAIVDGRPETLGLKDILRENVKFQYETATRKYTYLLNKELEQKEIKEGLIRACNVIDLIIEILRGSNSLKDAKDCLINGNTEKIKFKNKESVIYASQLSFTEKQAQAILDLRLYKLIGLEILALEKEYEAIVGRIAKYEDILNNRSSMTKEIKKELMSIKKEYGVSRRTVIEDGEAAVVIEEKIEEMEVTFLMDRFGYAKTVDMAAAQRNRESLEAENKYMLTCLNTDKICVFTDNGSLHQVKVMDIPFVRPKDKGTPIDNLGNYDSSKETIVNVVSLGSLKDKKLLFTTRLGMMKLVDSSEFVVSKKTVAATKLNDGDMVADVNVIGSDNMEDTLNMDNDLFMSDVPESFDTPYDEDFDGQLDMFAGLDDMSGGSIVTGAFDYMSGGSIASNIQGTEELSGNENGNNKQFVTEKLVTLRTSNNLFLRFPLSEVPEKKKGAVGVRGLKLTKEEVITNVYVSDAGDSVIIEIAGTEYDLRKLTVKKRDQSPQKPKK